MFQNSVKLIIRDIEREVKRKMAEEAKKKGQQVVKVTRLSETSKSTK